jgi:hypothetical protein
MYQSDVLIRQVRTSSSHLACFLSHYDSLRFTSLRAVYVLVCLTPLRFT